MLVLDIVTDSLRQIGIIGESETPSADQGQDAVTRLNDLMASLAEDDIDLGWNPKDTTGDAAVLPLGEVPVIKALLAINLAGEYGVEVPQPTLKIAHDGYQRLLRKAIQQVMRVTRLYVMPRGNFQTVTNRIETDQS
jgi:hypothetical protein